MKKTLHIDEALLKEARSVSGARSDTDAAHHGRARDGLNSLILIGQIGRQGFDAADRFGIATDQAKLLAPGHQEFDEFVPDLATLNLVQNRPAVASFPKRTRASKTQCSNGPMRSAT